jgi:dienelactone hydrolase
MDPRITRLYDDYPHRPPAGARYDKAAAELAWSRTMAFFRKALG